MKKGYAENLSLKALLDSAGNNEMRNRMKLHFGMPYVHEALTMCFRSHYVEYLGTLIRRNRLDPIEIMTNDDLEVIIRRANEPLPPRAPGETPEEYRPKLLQV